MTKKQTPDSTVDSDELQALFDSIASSAGPEEVPAPVQAAAKPAPAKVPKSVPAPAPAVVAPVAAPAAPVAPAATQDKSGDDSELQALFDAVSAEFQQAHAEVPAAVAAEPAAGHSDTVFTQIGQMTRQVHDTLRALGSDSPLHDTVRQIPDARQRLNYITHMTEQAASKVLNATDIAKPMQDRVQEDAGELGRQWDKLFANELSVDEFKALANETRSFIRNVENASRDTNAQLMEIMMAQDFQDLTGQIIKKVVDMAQLLESQLLSVLIEVAPQELREQKGANSLLNGPVFDAKGRDDVVTTQEQVDDLLDSLGF